MTTHVAYYFCLVNAYRFGDLSRVYPLARGLAPPLVAIGAALVAGEWLDVHEVLGIALVSFGIASLVAGARGGAERRGLWFAAATGATIGIYTIIDGLGAPLGAARAQLHRLAEHVRGRGGADRRAGAPRSRRVVAPCASRSRTASWPA